MSAYALLVLEEDKDVLNTNVPSECTRKVNTGNDAKWNSLDTICSAREFRKESRNQSKYACELAAEISSADVDTQELLSQLVVKRKKTKRGSFDVCPVRFKLTINGCGRSYTCVRTLLKFIELRNRLAKEIKQKSDVIHIPELPIPGIPSMNLNNENVNESMCKASESSTPPPIYQSFGGSFSTLQRVVCGQVNSMNDWLSQICSLMPTSPSLLTFLWESPSVHLGTIYEVNEDGR